MLVLIPKVPTPESFTQIRPISPCNVAFKVIAKTIANRIKPWMSHLVAKTHFSFVPSRHIMVIVQEVIHFIRIKNGKEGCMAIKIDLQKA